MPEPAQDPSTKQHTRMLTAEERESLYHEFKVWQARDIDAGEVDVDLEDAIREWDPFIANNDKKSNKNLDWNLSIFADYHEFFDVSKSLKDSLTDVEQKVFFPQISGFIARAQKVGALFPYDLEEEARYSYGESVANVLYALLALQQERDIPASLPLRGGHDEPITRFNSIDDGVNTIVMTNLALDRIWKSTLQDQPVERVAIPNPNKTLNTGIYRLGQKRDVLATVRLLATSKLDPSIEYGGSSGTQASIGYVTQENGGFIPEEKDKQKSEFSIRIDNEGDTLSLDIGSIRGREGTLGKRIADLIAIGDMYRTEIRGDKELSLNHNVSKFLGTGLEQRELFAVLASEKAAEFENRATATEISRLGLSQKAGA